MIRSMTGYGRAEVAGARMALSVECKSVNHRHLDIALKLPRAIGTLEADARRLVQSAMAELAPAGVERRAARLRARIQSLLGEASLDEGRIATEVAVWAEKTDITEELARLRAHLEQFALLLRAGGTVGRTLDFLVQEI